MTGNYLSGNVNWHPPKSTVSKVDYTVALVQRQSLQDEPKFLRSTILIWICIIILFSSIMSMRPFKEWEWKTGGCAESPHKGGLLMSSLVPLCMYMNMSTCSSFFSFYRVTCPWKFGFQLWSLSHFLAYCKVCSSWSQCHWFVTHVALHNYFAVRCCTCNHCHAGFW